jgi:hypothetical protein
MELLLDIKKKKLKDYTSGWYMIIKTNSFKNSKNYKDWV